MVSVLAFSFVSFLLTFPNFGPTSFAIIEEHGIDPKLFFTIFYVTHIAGLLFAGMVMDRVERRLKVAKLSALILFLSAMLSNFLPLLSIALIGFFLGVLADVMGGLLGRIVRPWRRGMVIAISVSLANVLLFLFSIQRLKPIHMTILSSLPLIPTILLPEIRVGKVDARGINPEMLRFVPPVVIFYLLAGFMYQTMEPVFREMLSNFHVLSYVFAILVAGALYDRIGRRITTILGLLLLGLSFALFPKHPVASAYTIQASYAFLDVFSILIWVDLAYYGTESKHYGIGTSILVASILAGYWAMNLMRLNPFDFGLLSLILLILSALFVASAKEPMMSPEDYVMRGVGRDS